MFVWSYLFFGSITVLLRIKTSFCECLTANVTSGGFTKARFDAQQKRWLEQIEEINFLKCPQLSCAVTSSHAKSVFAKLHLDGPACLSLFVIEGLVL